MPAVEHRHVMSPYFRCVVDVVEDSKVGKREKVRLVMSLSILNVNGFGR
jgi:hypothetical protein